LSHGWGKQHPPKTLRANVQENMKGIHVGSLSIKFQQVIHFVRQLGIDSLWIDSLCIIQDDEFDKLEELPRMSDIYSNSVLTIAASQSSDSEGQLFSSDSSFRVGFRLSDAKGSFQNNLLIRKYFPHESTRSTRIDWATTGLYTTFPLLKRAWVLQERILSTRILRFGENELHWECSTTASCECGIEDAGNIKPSILNISEPNGMIARGQSMPPVISFGRLISYYSELELSHESDILFALKGIITKVEGITGDQNVVGLWKKQLGWCLCWTVARPSPRRRHAKVPTWSWASVLTPISYQVHEVGDVNSSAILTLAHPHKAPSNIALQLRRHVIRGTLKRQDEGRYLFEYSTEISVEFKPDISEIDDEVLYLVEVGPMSRTGRKWPEFPCLILQHIDHL
jgi:hypothetical protein